MANSAAAARLDTPGSVEKLGVMMSRG